jgi:hypothetical protein
MTLQKKNLKVMKVEANQTVTHVQLSEEFSMLVTTLNGIMTMKMFCFQE